MKKEKNDSKSIIIEVLIEGPGGELLFQPIEATPKNFEELLKTTRNSMIQHNLKKQKKKFEKETA
jgi:hypothetical protein